MNIVTCERDESQHCISPARIICFIKFRYILQLGFYESINTSDSLSFCGRPFVRIVPAFAQRRVEPRAFTARMTNVPRSRIDQSVARSADR
jgi:hypothetical protein